MKVSFPKGPKRDFPPPQLRMETDSVPETLCYLEYRTVDKFKIPAIPDAIQHHQNRLEFT
jgi:hypothetical protein